MEVLYHIRPNFVGISPHRYLQSIGSCCVAIGHSLVNFRRTSKVHPYDGSHQTSASSGTSQSVVRELRRELSKTSRRLPNVKMIIVMMIMMMIIVIVMMMIMIIIHIYIYT